MGQRAREPAAISVLRVGGVSGRRIILRGHNFNYLPAPYCSVCSSLPGLKRTALPGGIDTSAPVRGLRPMPVLRGLTLKTPKPRSSMRSPCSKALFMDSKTVSTAISALVLVSPVLFTTSLMRSSLIKMGLPEIAGAHSPLSVQPHDRITFIRKSSWRQELLVGRVPRLAAEALASLPRSGFRWGPPAQTRELDAVAARLCTIMRKCPAWGCLGGTRIWANKPIWP